MSESLPTFGINGFGRIGRTAFRVWWKHYRQTTQLVAINTSGSMELENWVHLLKYDSNYGRFEEEIIFDQQRTTKELTETETTLGTITIGGHVITVTAQRDPAKIPWANLGVKTVIESTGAFTTKEKAGLHLQAGAQHVIISAPGKDDSVPTSIIGINALPNTTEVASNASCTTNCVAPIAQVIQLAFGIEKAMLTTIHSYTDDQNTHDNSHRDLRRARAAAQNIIPTSTGAAVAVTEVVTELKGLFDGLAIRVPTPVGSLSDMVFLVKRNVTIEEVNQALIEASRSPQWAGILAVTDDEVVSTDIIGRRESSIVDLKLTNVIGGNLVKVISWYDNEYGYCNRLLDQVISIG